MHKKDVILSLIGLFAGLASALFGVGGGLILIPGLILLAKFHMNQAVATSLLTIIPITLFGASIQLFQNYSQIYFMPIIVIVIFAFIGSAIGVHYAHSLSHKVLVKMFAVLVILLSFIMFDFISFGAIELSKYFLPVVGIIVGLISGFFGLSGGVILVPILIKLFAFDTKIAIATSLVSIAPIAMMSTYLHHAKGALPKHVLHTVVPFALAGVIIGSFIVLYISSGILETLFGIFLLIVAMRLFFKH